MGIKNLHTFLRNHLPTVYNDVHISHYQGKKIAIDINLYLYQFKNAYKDKWLNGLIKMINILVRNRIEFIFIFDTKAPIEKDSKKIERKSRKKDAENKIEEIKIAQSEYKTTGNASPILLEISRKRLHSRLLQPCDLQEIDEDSITKELKILQNQITNVSREDYYVTKQLLQALGIVYINSPTEAETLCCYLCILGVVDAVLSNDTDVLAYGTQIFVTKFMLRSEWCVEIRMDKILTGLNWTIEQFRDFCIMCGTDYNTNIPHIGPTKSFGYIDKYKNIENVKLHNPTLDIEGYLKYERIRDIFTVQDLEEDYTLLRIDRRAPHKEEAMKLASEQNCKLAVEEYLSMTDIMHLTLE